MSPPEWTAADDAKLASAMRNIAEPRWTMLALDYFPRRTGGEVCARYQVLVREGRT